MKFYDAVGYAVSAERPEGSGVWEDVITERKLYGEVIKDNRALTEGDKVNHDISFRNRFSLVADGYAKENYGDIKYIMWRGIRLLVTDIDVQFPRIILTPGGVYNGPTPSVPGPPEGEV